MSYTNGGQTIEKSMNGVIVITDGQGTTISNGTITTTNLIASVLNVPNFTTGNLICDTIVVHGSASFESGLSSLALITSTSEIHSDTLISSSDDITSGGVVIAPYLNATSAVYFGVNQLIQAAVLTEKLIFTNSATPSGSRSYQFLNGTTSLLLMENALITLGVATTTASNITLTGTAKLTSPTITSTILYFDTAELVKAQVASSRCIFTNLGATIGNRSYEFNIGAAPVITPLKIEAAVITLGASLTTDSNLSLTGTSILSLASGTSISLASGSSMSSAGNISLTTAANFTTSSSGVFFNSAQDMSIKAVVSQMQFNIANTATAPRSYQFKLAALTPLLIEATTTTITNSATATASVNALEIKNSEGTPSQINILLNAAAATANPNVAAGDDVIYSNGGILNLTTTSATSVGIRMSPTDIQTRANTTTLTGTTFNNDITNTTFNGTTTNLTSATTNINGATLTAISTPTTTITGATCNHNSTTNNIAGTTCNINTAGTLAISTSTATTFVNLPSTTTTFTTASTNQFITKNIADNIYAPKASPTFTGTASIPSLSLTNALTLPNNSTATTQAATDSSTLVATTRFVNRNNWLTNPLSIYFNIGVGGGSGLLNLQTMNFDPLYANAPVLTNANMNFTAIRLDQGTTYTGMTTYYSTSPAGGTIRLALFSAAGALLASTGTYTSVGTTGHYSLNFTSVYTPSTLQMVYATSYVLVATTINQMSSSTGAISPVNCSPAPTATACNGRSFFITKPATFPTTLTGIAKTATAISFWYGLY